MPLKKKQKRSADAVSLSMSLLCRDAMNASFEGKHVLLRASEIYRGRNRPPVGEENYLYLYSIVEVNSNCKSAFITFADSYVEEGDEVFRDYPKTDTSNDKDESIKEYCLSRFTEDHKRYNYYLSKEAMKIKKEQQANEKSAPIFVHDTSDITRQFTTEG